MVRPRHHVSAPTPIRPRRTETSAASALESGHRSGPLTWAWLDDEPVSTARLAEQHGLPIALAAAVPQVCLVDPKALARYFEGILALNT
jgi:hypothetical protein